MKILALSMLVLSIMLPNIALAAWYNPLTWFDSWTFSRTADEVPLKTEKRIPTETPSTPAPEQTTQVVETKIIEAPAPKTIIQQPVAPIKSIPPSITTPAPVSVQLTASETTALTEPNTVAGSGAIQVQVFKEKGCAVTCPYYGTPVFLREADTLRDVISGWPTDQNGIVTFKNLKPGKYRVDTVASNTYAGQIDITVYPNLLTKGKIFFQSYTTNQQVPLSINMISPKAGDVWKMGSRKFVRWDPSTIPKDYVVGIMATSNWGSGGFDGMYYASINDGIEEILVPTDVEPNHVYSVNVLAHINGRPVGGGVNVLITQ